MGASGGSGSTGGSLRNGLVTAQVALSLALLVGAGMMLQAYLRFYHSDPGYDTRHVLVAPLRYPAGRARAIRALICQLDSEFGRLIKAGQP